MDQKPLQKYLQQYEETIGKIAGRYYWYSVRGTGNYDLDLSDFEQVGRIAVFNISRKRPEKLDNQRYVAAAIKYAIFGEMRKMRRRERHVYLAREDEETIQVVDVFPTQEKGEKLDELEELLYSIKHEFSEKDASALEALLEKCDNIYDLNLSEPPSTDTKDRVRVVTRMDLNDEEMVVYAEVLLGTRERFPRGYIKDQKERMIKYFRAILESQEMTLEDFGSFNKKKSMLLKYRLDSFHNVNYHRNMLDFLLDLDPNIRIDNIFHAKNRWAKTPLTRIHSIIKNLVDAVGKTPEEIIQKDFIDNGLWGMLQKVFNGSPRLAIEFAYPRTFPEYEDRVKMIKEIREEPLSSNNQKNKRYILIGPKIRAD